MTNSLPNARLVEQQFSAKFFMNLVIIFETFFRIYSEKKGGFWYTGFHQTMLYAITKYPPLLGKSCFRHAFLTLQYYKEMKYSLEFLLILIFLSFYRIKVSHMLICPTIMSCDHNHTD